MSDECTHGGDCTVHPEIRQIHGDLSWPREEDGSWSPGSKEDWARYFAPGITQEMIDHLDARAGKQHSAEGSVLTTLNELIAMAFQVPGPQFGPLLRPGVTAAIAAHPARYDSGLLSRALSSVVAQKRRPEAIVVVNDEEGRGAGWTRRELLNLVQTEWVAWLDSDDEWEPEHLAKLMNVAVETDAVFVYSWFHGADPLGHFGLPFNPCTPHHTTMTHLVRTDVAREVGFPDSAAGNFSNEDWAFITGVSKLACERGLKMVHLAERTWHYHQHGQNTSGQPHLGDARS